MSDHNKIIHESIIDLYLQVKIRSNDQIDKFGQEQYNLERERLLKFGSLTVLDYIKTSIEILMQMKLDEDKTNDGNGKNGFSKALRHGASKSNLNSGRAGNYNDNLPSELSSTFKSIDLPPKEYEQ